MARQVEHSETPGILPAPQLNPLLNPLLAQNMGRWAEVYFTNPPEKREQAVMDLVRELEAQGSARDRAIIATPANAPDPSENVATANPEFSEVPKKRVLCPSCGRENRSSQKFCGMCGSRLAEVNPVTEPRREALHAIDRPVVTRPLDEPDKKPRIEDPAQDASELQQSQVYENEIWQNQENPSVPSEGGDYRPRLNTNELSLFQSIRSTDYEDSQEEFEDGVHTSGAYRIYVGIALALIICALAYMAWRSEQVTSRTSYVAPAAPPEVTKEPAVPSPAPSPAKADEPARTGARARTDAPPPTPANKQAIPAAKAVPQPVPAESSRKETITRAGLNRSTPAAQPRTPLAEKNPPAVALGEGGAEELAMARHYLNGANGQGRNSSEAAKWLWKAMAKHNAEATFLLSDLYLKGDGVSKNCDQARVLLDAAALQGMKDAGERLRHLQAFGCQ